MEDENLKQPIFADIELAPHDIQELNHSDALVSFFARLGYNTDARTVQTPGNLGITAEGTLRPIKKIELIADQEGLFQVYLFELKSVTVAQTRALARIFRNRAGNYLLVLTSDYEQLDFVLLHKYIPSQNGEGKALAPKQVGIRPRVLTVDRRKPGRVELRILRRFTYTEGDPIAHYPKLLSAYTVADWSEEYFNNRALFSDHYLKTYLTVSPPKEGDLKSAYLSLRETYKDARSRFAGKTEADLRKALFEPVFESLGFRAEEGKPPDSAESKPDYLLREPSGDGKPRALCLTYPWDRSLDGKDDQRDKETPDENPGAVVVSLLETEDVPWVIVTNGKLWRLYSKRAHSRATNYYEIDLEELLAEAGPYTADPAEAFPFFWILFRREAFEPAETQREGRTELLSFLERLFLESQDYAKRLGDKLKDRVFERIFPVLAEGFIAHIREQQGVDANLSDEALNTVFEGTLTLLYRVLFLLYAEARDLLPAKEVRGYYEASLERLKKEIADVGKAIREEAETRFRKHYSKSAYHLYGRLTALFEAVDQGDKSLNVPVYNGGLFLTKPEDEDHSAETRVSRFLLDTQVPDYYLVTAIDLLARDEEEKRQDLVFIDYKSLGVRQLGSIYEGLLEFKLRIASQKMAVVKGKRTEEVVPYKEIASEGRKILKRGKGKDAQERIYKKGQVYIENDKRERKATGSYYTPDHIVKYIVEHAVGPVVEEKLEALRPRFREAQKWNKEMVELAKAKGDVVAKYETGPAVTEKWGNLVKEFFDIKVLDPAMGSGHFLVEAVDFITDKMLDFLNAFPWNPVQAELQRTRETILHGLDQQDVTIDRDKLTDVNLLKRHVLKRCIYGVDLNPMAVELAKVSLWLDCFTLGAPLSFLDHHLRVGNSLIGSTVEDVDKIRQAKGQLPLSATSDWQGLLQAVQGMIAIGGLPDVTSEQVVESRRRYKSALSDLENFKKILDVHTARWFVTNGKPKRKGSKKKAAEIDRFDDILRSGDLFEWVKGKDGTPLDEEPYRGLLRAGIKAAAATSFFHWELEFPEVFYGPREGTTQVVERLNGAGFDSVIGNPPYGIVFDPSVKSSIEKRFPAFQRNNDLYSAFTELSFQLPRAGGFLSLIVPNTFVLGPYFASLKRQALKQATFLEILDFGSTTLFPDPNVFSAIYVGIRATPTLPWLTRLAKATIQDDRIAIVKDFKADLLLLGDGLGNDKTQQWRV